MDEQDKIYVKHLIESMQIKINSLRIHADSLKKIMGDTYTYMVNVRIDELEDEFERMVDYISDNGFLNDYKKNNR